jgi:hypothetical protein
LNLQQTAPQLQSGVTGYGANSNVNKAFQQQLQQQQQQQPHTGVGAATGYGQQNVQTGAFNQYLQPVQSQVPASVADVEPVQQQSSNQQTGNYDQSYDANNAGQYDQSQGYYDQQVRTRLVFH